MIKKILIPVILLFFFFSCKKGEAYLNNSFPGFSGSGDKATWVVYNHNFTDKPFIQSKLSSQTSFKTLGSFDISSVKMGKFILFLQILYLEVHGFCSRT
jgi:hypothetical protein